MHDNADPLNGWDIGDIERTLSGPATSDVYGKLHYHLRGVLGSFLRRISDAEVSFRLLNVDALYLDGFVEKGSFSRIEVRTQLSPYL
ncbi:hypothetical protein IMZ48_18275 [Candidatus Bathyarchaeota archaeon]|nr:hypothetical protein [Candidatus Bathyarchaeota archaeon]